MRRRFALVSARAATFRRGLADRLSLLVARVSGQGLVEYGLILVLIMVVCVGIFSALGSTVSEVWYDQLINNGAWD